MYRLLPLVVLIFSTGCATDEMAGTDRSGGEARIVRQMDLPLVGAAPAQGQAPRKTFQARSVQGWLDATGAWGMTTEVAHSRGRCGTYETGIQIGKGDAACTRVDWLSDPDFGSRRTQCNAATLIHSGAGTIQPPRSAVPEANCVRVLVRCTGAC